MHEEDQEDHKYEEEQQDENEEEGHDHQRQKERDPSVGDIEDQLAHNEIHIFELDQARDRLQQVSHYWYITAAVCLAIGLLLASPAVIQTGAISGLFPQSIVGQTIWNTLMALAMVGAIACHIRFMTLRRLARDAWEVADFNRHVINSVRGRPGRAS
ncbi:MULTISPECIES: CopD family protein [Rhizobium]|uniref:CopD family protein n=1 Tax=Rhizobium TaxID=379 RepID=UPI0010319F33|nr:MULTISPECIES: CopD family protein [Rhizobium]TBF24862.1 CopD family protein [Rhizobium leguminosarum]WSH48953.1 hypothetical protein U8P77_35240 [Rhizobium johnstonii]